MPFRCRAFGLAALLLLHLVGCASNGVDVSTTFDPLTHFPRQATYAWDDAASRLPDKPRLAGLDLGPLIKEVADEAFAARGYRAVASGSPDYRLSYEVTVHTWFGPDNTRSVGSLSLLLVEAATNHRVWLGFGRAEVRVGLTREERRQRLRKSLDRMLAKFPPSGRGD